MIKFGTVDDAFHISGRGCVVSFDFLESLDPNFKIRVGDEIQLHSTGGLIIETKIKGIEHLNRPIRLRKPVNLGLLLPADVGCEHLSKGMELWLVQDAGRNV